MTIASRSRFRRSFFIVLGIGLLAGAPPLAAQAAKPPASTASAASNAAAPAATLAAAPAAAPAASPAAPAFDAEAATNAYLAKFAGEARAKSDAYFEGGYWLQLWGFLLGVVVNLLLLGTGLSNRMRNLSERVVRFRPIQTFLYWVQYLLVTTVVLLPMTIYEGFFREHKYGLSNQAFGPWAREQMIAIAVGLVLGGLAICALYGVVRRLVRTWALWGAVVAVALVVFLALIAPVYISPLFNTYTSLAEPVARERILSLARSEGIGAKDVFLFDASRQTKRVSANVSGFASTMRISLNDNLLNRSSLAEIEAVMGHEMGHYVMHHVYKSLLFFAVVIAIGFALLKWGFESVTARKGAAWGIRGVGDTAGLPLAIILLSTYFFILTPILNTYSRVEEAEADLFGINASGQPDGEAEADLKLGEYRKLDPSPVEEFVFYDHPGGRNRILMAMKWKGEHLAEAEANARRAAEWDRARGWSPESAKTWAKEHEPKP